MSRILFASSEAAPLIKTGGLADISGSLPAALKALRQAVRLIIPAYPQAMRNAGRVKTVATLDIGGHSVRVLEGRMPDSKVLVWLVDSPAHFSRDGGPYTDHSGHDWADNAERFALFSRVVVEISMNRVGLNWQPEVVHCNDWQTGLVPTLLYLEETRPGTVFSIHNLAYQGVFPYRTFADLGLPAALWSYRSLEYFGNLSFIKGGLVFADRLTTVSPTYAEEICTPTLGYGLDPLLRHRRDRLSGILNGVDYGVWDPSTDPLIDTPYTTELPAGKVNNKRALQRHFGLPLNEVPLLGMVSRMVEQKGIDLVLDAVPKLLGIPVQLVILGSGEKRFEQAALALAKRFPKQIGVNIGYDESLAHLIEAGSDMFLMPSRFEPCGLNQLYSLRYGTLPVVHRTGGLADTVIHTDPNSLEAGTATGFVFDFPDVQGLLWAIRQALLCYNKSDCWPRVMKNAMQQDFSWNNSASLYLSLYRQAIQDAGSG